MQGFRQGFDFYINSSIHVGLAVVSLTLVSGYTLNIIVPFYLLVFLFFSTITGYNFVKYAEVAGLHHRSLAKSLKSIQIFSVFCGLGMLVTAVQLSLEVWLACAILGVITLLYAVPFFITSNASSVSKRMSLRNVSGLKIFIIGLVWAGVTVLLPVLENGLLPYWDFWVLCGQRFLFIIAVMIPFEIRDLSFDTQELKTLPQVFGVQRAKQLGCLWLVLAIFLEFLKQDFILAYFLIQVVVYGLVAWCITVARERTSSHDYFSSFWVEGVPLVWLWLVLFSNFVSAL